MQNEDQYDNVHLDSTSSFCFNTMHIIQANIGMWLDHQRSLWKGFQSMGAYFLSAYPEFFRKNAEVQSYINYIKKENPDVVYLTEVCWVEQRDALLNALEQDWYATHVIEWFELWNMQEDSYKYLYHIMGSKIPFQHRQTIQQYTSNKVIRFLKRNNGIGKESPLQATQVNAILDGGGSRYTIWDIEIGLMHAHAMDKIDVFTWLTQWLKQSRESRVLIGDMNMQIWSSERIMNQLDPDLKRVGTERTYPYYFTQNSGGIFTQAINRQMVSKFLSHPDQAFVNPTSIELIGQKTLGPKETWLKTDHAVNHYRLRKKN